MATDTHIIETLSLLAMGEIEAADAAAALGLDLPGLEDLVESHPDLAEQAAEKAKALQTDPDHTLAVSQQGLHNAAMALARRLQENPDALTVNEMVSAGGLLEKIAGVSEKRKLEIKAEVIGESPTSKPGDRLPLFITDTRPNPTNGSPRLLTLLIEHEHPAWVDTTDPQFQSPQYDWLDHHLPLSPETGQPLDLQNLTAHANFRYMDARGRVFGGHL